MTAHAGGVGMDEAETIELYEATDRDGNGLRNVFVLGSLCDRNEQIAVSRQQVRALNLIHALMDLPRRRDTTPRLQPGSKLCVVGAGAAGLTAAALAHAHGVDVTVLESREPLWNLRGCRTRWLHPNLFARWPHDGWDVTATNFPVMNWYADYADRVGELLWAKYKSYVPAGRAPCRRIHGASLGITSNGTPRATWRERNEDAVDEARDFDVVILAVGFGSEARMRDAASSEYWVDDALERANPRGHVTRYLVSGTGDGGLTDLLRLRLTDFRHHHLRDVLAGLESLTAARGAQRSSRERSLLDAVREIEARAAAANKRASGDHERRLNDERLTRELVELFDRDRPPPFLGGIDAFRDDTRVLLVSREPVALSAGRAWPVSRFLTAAVLACDRGTRYRSVGAAGAKVATVVPPDGEAPSEFRIAIGNDVEVVDAIVFRHGTREILRSLRRRWGLAPTTISGLEEKWRDAWVLHGSTADQLFSGTSVDNLRRDKTWHARPTVAGRTLIGMLSRLVAQIDPHIPVTGRLVFPNEPPDLIRDRMALLVTPIDAKRRPDDAPGPWRLAGKVDHQATIDAIQWLDQSLDPLCQDPAMVHALRQQLEHHWVLPRFDWLPRAGPRDLLINTCVARCWRSRRLSYENHNGGIGQLASIPEPTNLDDFKVIDLEGEPARVVLVQQDNLDNERLARQLCATHIKASEILRSIS
jgi:hypothetical protein